MMCVRIGFGVYMKEQALVNYVISMLRKQPFIGGAWRNEEIYNGKTARGHARHCCRSEF